MAALKLLTGSWAVPEICFQDLTHIICFDCLLLWVKKEEILVQALFLIIFLLHQCDEAEVLPLFGSCLFVILHLHLSSTQDGNETTDLQLYTSGLMLTVLPVLSLHWDWSKPSSVWHKHTHTNYHVQSVIPAKVRSLLFSLPSLFLVLLFHTQVLFNTTNFQSNTDIQAGIGDTDLIPIPLATAQNDRWGLEAGWIINTTTIFCQLGGVGAHRCIDI